MKCFLKVLFAGFALLAFSPLSGQSQKSYILTETEYSQIIYNMMTAQKALTDCQNQLTDYETQLHTLKNQLKAQSAYLSELKNSNKKKCLVAGSVCFSFGALFMGLFLMNK